MWASLDSYARRHGVAGDRFDRISRLLHTMDSVWLKVMADRAKADTKK
jgi:hypothetical protein